MSKPSVAIFALLALHAAVAQKRPVFKGGAQQNEFRSLNQVIDEKGFDRETGQGFTSNSMGKGCTVVPYRQPGYPPPILIYVDTVRELCYWWLPNGPEQSYDPPAVAPRLPAAPGAYDPCQNPVPPPGRPGASPGPAANRQPPPSGMPPSRTPAKPVRNYFKDRAERTEGFKQGLRDCFEELRQLPGAVVQLFYDTGYVASLAGQGNMQGALQQLGLERHWNALQQELNPDLLGTTPAEQGRHMAIRICHFGIMPQAGNAVGKVVTRGFGPGSSALRPMAAAEVHKVISTNVHIPDLRAMQGKWVDLGHGPVELGKLRGQGSYGVAYELPGTKQIVKLSRSTDVAPLRDQVRGYNDLKTYAPNVATPNIRGVHWGNGTTPGHLIMDDAQKAFRSYEPPSNGPYTPIQNQAIRRMNTELGKGDLVWVDGHGGNRFFYRDAGGTLRAGAIDTDMMYRSANSAVQRDIVRTKEADFAAYFRESGYPIQPTVPSALGFMEALNTAFFSGGR